MLAAQANAICERKKRKTIMPEDVIEALKVQFSIYLLESHLRDVVYQPEKFLTFLS